MKEPKPGEPFRPYLTLDGALIPYAILKDPTLSASARLLWGMLGQYQGKGAECFPLVETLAAEVGVKVRQLQSYIKELENYTQGDPPQPLPLLQVKRVYVPKEGRTRNTYHLIWQPFLAVNLKTNGAGEAYLADVSDAQSSAHRSDGDAQGAAGAQPAIPKDRGVVPDGIAAADTQSSANWSAGDAQNGDASPATLTLGRDSRALPPEVAPEDRVVPAAYGNPAWSRRNG